MVIKNIIDYKNIIEIFMVYRNIIDYKNIIEIFMVIKYHRNIHGDKIS
jgi:hypothetical protein